MYVLSYGVHALIHKRRKTAMNDYSITILAQQAHRERLRDVEHQRLVRSIRRTQDEPFLRLRFAWRKPVRHTEEVVCTPRAAHP
jgi:hypothetical protein